MNRGFLNGPVCPVYGFGMVAMLVLLGSHAQNPLAVFLAGVIVPSLVELIAGALMYWLFHARWWDYSDKPYNIGGFICLQFSLAWGAASIVMVMVIPMADWLGLDTDARINTPGRPDGNWQWRAKPGVFTSALAGEIRTLSARYFRAEAPKAPKAAVPAGEEATAQNPLKESEAVAVKADAAAIPVPAAEKTAHSVKK